MDYYIYRYTRKQALEDGVLIDITQKAKRLGFKYHTAITSNLYYSHYYDKENEKEHESFLEYTLILFIRKIVYGKGGEQDILEMKVMGEKVWMHIGPGDDPEPVITIMKPEDY